MKAFSKLANRLAPLKTQSPEPTQQPVAPLGLPAPVNGSIQILSDLHLEFCKQYTTFIVPEISAPYLVLVGDIGRLRDYELLLVFLEVLVAKYRCVFYVMGDHEFCGIGYADGINAARRLEKEPNLEEKLSILHRTRWDEDSTSDDSGSGSGSGLTILDCKLWSQIVPEFRDTEARSISEFKHIHDWNVDMHSQVHAEEVAWLREQVAAVHNEDGGAERTIVVVTHDVPTVEGMSSPKYASSPWSSAFSTELVVPPSSGVVTGARPSGGKAAWIYGHTHYCNDFVREGIRLGANQRGCIFPPNPLAPARSVAVVKTEKKSIRRRDRNIGEEDKDDGEHVFNPAKTISY